jgi:membrane protease YdiL (CAAX protease family)
VLAKSLRAGGVFTIAAAALGWRQWRERVTGLEAPTFQWKVPLLVHSAVLAFFCLLSWVVFSARRQSDALLALWICAGVATLGSICLTLLPAGHWSRLLRGPGWAGFALGIPVLGLWLFLAPDGESNGCVSSLYALGPVERALRLTTRILSAVLVVPVAEELTFRGFVMRPLISERFEWADWQKFTWLSFVISSIAFGLLHGRMWLAGSLVGLVFAYAVAPRQPWGCDRSTCCRKCRVSRLGPLDRSVLPLVGRAPAKPKVAAPPAFEFPPTGIRNARRA